ncbi:MAG: 4-amino-4-deoxy-L-arabinose transferase-like protein glycosyltransferase of PMT family [Candidatus Woesebacteria bacterium]|nr:MAG: 4-amino-4-deoxy-L-arabinose transferase-like protein glycosyltransferase of PMT family [Candidatus Woesebacteria bacterium]
MDFYLTFSDSAKYADVARNFVLGRGWGTSFSFWGERIFEVLEKPLFQNTGILPFHSLSIAFFFKILGISDFAVIANSFFYFLLTLVFVYLLAKKIFNSKLIGFLSTLAVGANYNLIDYATSGASESTFIFQIVASLYFVSLKKKWANFLMFFFLILMYFTRTQAFIYIAGIILYWLLINFKPKKALSWFLSLVLFGLLVDYFLIPKFQGRFFLYSVTSIGNFVSLQHSPNMAVSDALRGLPRQSFNFLSLFKKVFYNLYNFYKLMPQILNPYLFTLFVIGLFSLFDRTKEGQTTLQTGFKVASFFMVVLTLLVTAAGIPFFRYIHPVVPLVYIVGVGTLVGIINKFQITNYKQIPSSKLQIPNSKSQTNSKQVTKRSFLFIGSCILVLFLAVGQTLGILLLDSRFEARTHNVGKPPVYVELSKILKENTEPNQVIVTNLDTWGTWYGERKTVWFPLEPKQLIDEKTQTIPFDAIYLTSYKIDDPNYYMGEDWRMIFENPQDKTKWKCDGCDKIAEEYELKGVYQIEPSKNYERMDAKAILLVKIPNYKSQITNKSQAPNSKLQTITNLNKQITNSKK